MPDALRTGQTGSASLAVTFNQITDGNGCTRDLQVRGKSSSITYNVKTSSPTARFAGRPEERLIQLVEGASRSVPLRLTGERPWTVEWDFEDENGNVKREKKTLGAPNEFLTFAKRGQYRLVSVKDAHCVGKVVEQENMVSIDYIGRPKAALEPMETLSVVNEAKKQYVHQPMCAGEEGIVTLALKGESRQRAITLSGTDKGQAEDHSTSRTLTNTSISLVSGPCPMRAFERPKTWASCTLQALQASTPT